MNWASTAPTTSETMIIEGCTIAAVDEAGTGARCLGREREIGSLEPGKPADIALWRIDDSGLADRVVRWST